MWSQSLQPEFWGSLIGQTWVTSWSEMGKPQANSWERVVSMGCLLGDAGLLRYIRHREGGPGGTPTPTNREERVEAAKGAEGGVVCEGGGGGPKSREVREFPQGGVADPGAAEKYTENRK